MAVDDVLANLDEDNFFEIRADQLTLETIENKTSIDGPALNVVRELLVPGAKLIVGPRGCGKTHLMRYAWAYSLQKVENPFCVYVSFNRYYRLEPLLKSKANALDLFHGWMICLCYLGIYESVAAHLERKPDVDADDLWVGYSKDVLEGIVSRLERGAALPADYEEMFETLSLQQLKSTIDRLMSVLRRKRSIILLDDAALTLAPEYLPDFFDFFRTIKSPTISPKASVYPGTTEYGPRFHVAHEADEVAAWFSVESPNYLQLMESIGSKRLEDYERIPQEIRDLFKYAAFGIPRAYLYLLNEFQGAEKSEGTSQSKVNSILESFIRNKEAEYLSLSIKIPKFHTIITGGMRVFHKMCSSLVEENQSLLGGNEKQLLVGIQESAERNIYVDRMFSLLIEAGLLYGFASVSHGKSRVYERFVPHIAFLIRDRAFSEGKGFSPGKIVDVLKRPSPRHPLRRSISTLLDFSALKELKFDLPPCQNCHAGRLSESQKHCHNCGAKLTDASSFKSCMEIQLSDIPTLTQWQKNKLRDDMPDVRTVGDFLALQDPGSELRKMSYIGPRRAVIINKSIEIFVDEFLS
jgi:hypothetical protein